ncbi:SgcJ/EcaC family oxidoreductase [Paraburkholderia sp. DHOC27]|uniref:YybH family protein n=1 Tax=Paraburkholderia sp. DHOC27 TaxID=2303330 RepID=UPI001C704222|nr:SgcJ/EcaC family oxidoreductase [Paraburkholderia sp. DHOC27]
MQRPIPSVLATLLISGTLACAAIPSANASASHPSSQEARAAAAKLGQLYDSNYAAKNADAMAQLYAEDGTLVSPAGKLIKGRPALRQYYEARFSSGAKEHHIHVIDANAQGNGGFSIAEFSVQVPQGDGTFRQESGHIMAVYVKDSDGWHFRAVEPSVAPKE